MDSQTPHNLPEQPNALLGRDQMLQAAREQLLSQGVRLLSLTGPPGVGKTRLAMAVAQSCLDAFPEGVWLIDLAPLRDPALVGSEIASLLGVVESRDETTLDRLAAYLRGRRMLLCLDNFESVLQAAPWIGRLLEQTPGLQILTTCRERLRLRWEQVLPVPPLPLPDPGPSPDLSMLSANPSVALFVERAKAANPGFAFAVENAPAVAAVCAHLDGLPLAIELAAAHADVLDPREILTYMDDRFRLLGMGALDVPERHQTLKSAIDWSYDSLPPALRRFLRQLAVFSGGFSLAAAEIVGEGETPSLDALASLIALAEKSLLNRARSPGAETRFALLESIRDYLLDRLRENGELEAVRRRHAAYYLALAEQNFSELKRGNQKARFDLLESEHDNLRAALQWSLDAGEPWLGRRIAVAVWNFWWLRGHLREGLRWLQAFLAGEDETGDEVHVRILEAAGTLRGWQKDYEPGRALLGAALQIAEARADQVATVNVLFRLGLIFWINGKTEEAAWLAARIEACPPDAPPWELAHAHLSLGYLLYEAGLDEAAENAFTRSRAYFYSAQEKHVAILAGSKLALLRQKQGAREEAHEEITRALEVVRQSTDLYVVTYCVDDAVQFAARQMPDPDGPGEPVIRQMARILGTVDHWMEALNLLRAPRAHAAYQHTVETLQRALGDVAYLRTWQEGRSGSVESAAREAAELLAAVHALGPNAARALEKDTVAVASSVLSERERQVLELIADGLTNQEIGERLTIAERTVRFHVTSIFNKLGADHRAQAVAIANRMGLL